MEVVRKKLKLILWHGEPIKFMEERNDVVTASLSRRAQSFGCAGVY